MNRVVNLESDVEELLRKQVRDRNLEFDLVLNEAVRAGLSLPAGAAKRPFVQKTYPLGSEHVDLKKALALADELADEEVIRKMKQAETR
jgi:hypothetical protein